MKRKRKIFFSLWCEVLGLFLPVTYQDWLEWIYAYTDFSQDWQMILIIFSMKFFLAFSIFFIKMDGIQLQ